MSTSLMLIRTHLLSVVLRRLQASGHRRNGRSQEKEDDEDSSPKGLGHAGTSSSVARLTAPVPRSQTSCRGGARGPGTRLRAEYVGWPPARLSGKREESRPMPRRPKAASAAEIGNGRERSIPRRSSLME